MNEVFACINFALLCVVLWRLEETQKERFDTILSRIQGASDRLFAVEMQVQATKAIQAHVDTKRVVESVREEVRKATKRTTAKKPTMMAFGSKPAKKAATKPARNARK